MTAQVSDLPKAFSYPLPVPLQPTPLGTQRDQWGSGSEVPALCALPRRDSCSTQLLGALGAAADLI